LNLGARAGQYEIDLLPSPGEDPNDLRGNVAKAERFIRDGGEQPFFVVLATHDPQPTDRPAAVRWQDPEDQRPPRRLDPAKLVVPSHLPDRPDVRASLEEYYELIERLDARTGDVMKMLDRTGQAKNTLVMFFSDQGAPYPNGGYSEYDPGVRVPMIVVNPESRRHGVVSDAMVTLADVTPTILDWTGVPPPPYALHGRSFLPVLEQEKTSGWNSVVLSHVMHEVTMYYPMRAIRTRRYKLIWNLCHQLPWRDASEVTRWSTWAETLRRGDTFIGKRSIQNYIWRPVVELYDLEKDPDEVINLADDSKFSPLRRELSEKLLARLRATGDNWLERYQLPMPGEEEQISAMSPPGYSPPRPPGLDEMSIIR
jgi:N-sulfoglucosamine sulfohydrolase